MVERKVALMAIIAIAALTSCRRTFDSEGFQNHKEYVQASSFVSSDLLWCIVNDGTLISTKDGGAKWDKPPLGAVGNFIQLSFISSKTGWAVDQKNQIWKTSDGGRDWQNIAKLKSPLYSVFSVIQILFYDDIHGWIVEAPASVWRTTDGGINWKEQSIKGGPYKLFFISSQKGWLITEEGILYFTKDGGEAWESIFTDPNQSNLHSIFFVNERTGWLSGWPQSGLHRTDDGGYTWNLQLPQVPEKNLAIHSIYFINEQEGWVVGQKWEKSNSLGGPLSFEDKKGVLFHTTNGGKTWRPVQINNDEPFYNKVHFTDSLRGWLTSGKAIYRTDDGGKNWKNVFSSP
jgi:photosystem II stability/assembly factor-like uncharacterized protein